MKITHFRSDVNGQKTKRNFKVPTQVELTKATPGKINPKALVYERETGEKVVIFKASGLVEVKQLVGNSLSNNLYRDIYRIHG